ncbi:MAG TPA: ATP-grasp domain-containing protein, partial [Methylophilaceae bacterium]|nr:ATP-grasp domain-containing protein [Methylophilaceae bacterium]
FATAAILQAAGIEAVPTYHLDSWPEHATQRWVAKADDGAGCVDSRYFDNAADLRQWMQGRETTHVIQPYLPGTPASLCVLCNQGQAWLLSCNVQKIMLEAGSFSYAGSVLNGAAQHWRSCESLAKRVAQAMPGLSGYVGIDILISGGQPWVLEINPRLTTSYVGLHQAMACNPARLVIDLLYNGRLPLSEHFSRNVVQIELDAVA